MAKTTCSLKLTDDLPAELFRADRAVQSLTGASRRRTQGLFDHQCVQLNGVLCHTPWKHLAVGDVVRVEYDPDAVYAAVKRPPKYLGFEILFEDDYLIVVSKPAAWLTVPSPKGERNTLVQRVAEYLTKRNRGRRVRVWAVHRLDRGVSGVLVMARDVATATALRQEFAEHKPQRRYVAIVAGTMSEATGEFRSRLAAGTDLRQRSVDEDEPGQDAVTHYEVQSVVGDATLVHVRLETGRRNQIRVHFAEAGHPVLGDPLYASEQASHPRWPHARLALHAERLDFRHPVTGQDLRFVVPLPDEFTKFSIEANGGRQ